MLKRPKPLGSVFFICEDSDPVEREALFHKPSTVLEVAIAHKIPLSHSCEGMASCGTCRIEVLACPTELEERNELEAEMAADRGFLAKERLACQIQARDGLRVKVPISSDED